MSACPLLAFGFASPAILPGLLLAGAPILIHLLSRRRYREIDWAAIQWLLAAIKKHARRIRLEQLLLLAVRTALVLSVVLGMSRPYLERIGVPLLSGKRTHRILVLDASLSMGYQLADRARFDRAKDVALAILDDSHPGDIASLLLLATPPRVIVGDASGNLNAVAAELRALELLHGTADLPATLSTVEKILAASTLDQKEVYFISDLQRVSWAGGNRGGPFRELVSRLAAESNLVIIDLGKGDAQNNAIVSFAQQPPFVTVGKNADFVVTARNFGRIDSGPITLSLLVDGEPQMRRTIELPASGQKDLLMTTTFVTPGAHLVEARLEGDSLPMDDHRWLALDAKEHINVLVVDGEPSGSSFDSESDYLRVALDPNPESSAYRSTFRPEVVHESEFAQLELARFDCVIFANVGQFTEQEIHRLEGYLLTGGSLIWFLGDQIDTQLYNHMLFNDGEGSFPVRLGSIVGNAGARQDAFRFDPLDYAHPIVQPFRGATHGGLLTTKVFQYVRAEVPAQTSARVALAYEGGDPAIVTATAGHGRVTVVTTSADVEWTNWPYWYSYVPIVNEIVSYSLADRGTQRNFLVGQPLTQLVPPTALGVIATVRLPGEQSEQLQVPPGDSPRYLEFDRTLWSGGYWVKIGPPLATNTLYAANIDSSESDLTKLQPNELRELLPGWQHRYLTDWQAITSGQSSVTQNRSQLVRHLLMAALLLLFVESLLAWKFGHHSS